MAVQRMCRGQRSFNINDSSWLWCENAEAWRFRHVLFTEGHGRLWQHYIFHPTVMLRHISCEWALHVSFHLSLSCTQSWYCCQSRGPSEWHVTRNWGASGKINKSNKKRLTDRSLCPTRLCCSYSALQTHTHTPGRKSTSSLRSLHLDTKRPQKPVSFSQLGEERRSGDEERQQQLLESAWKLLICEHPAGLIQPLHECVCFHTGLLNSFISCHRRTSGVDK